MLKDLLIILRSRLIPNEVSLKRMLETKCTHCHKLVEDHEHDKMGTVQSWDFYHSVYKTSCKDRIKIMGLEFKKKSFPMGTGKFSFKYWSLK